MEDPEPECLTKGCLLSAARHTLLAPGTVQASLRELSSDRSAESADCDVILIVIY